jgi:cellulose synthase/poly-beta-1,6-N-acetylglucosamine synthase-like glycosyltransferase
MSELGLALLLTACGFLLYAYALYPLCVLALARLRPRPVERRDWLPSISLIITAHNEEAHIASKLDNALSLDYPPGSLEVMVASDGSTDRTHAIVESYGGRGVRLCATPGRAGKTAATQNAVRGARGELLVFSDATGMYNREALRRLAAAAAAPGVGCVSGRVEYVYGDSALARGFRWYQRAEKALRRAESACGTLTSVSGSIHAVRRDLFPPADPHQNYDLIVPLAVAHRGLRSVYEDGAVSTETARVRARDEFRARVRASIQALSYLQELRRLGWARRSPFYLWAALSHKLLRWLTPIWLLLLLAGHLALAAGGALPPWTLAPHLGVYLLALMGAVLQPGRGGRWLAGPTLLGAVCAGFLVGIVAFASGRRAAAWETSR